MQKQLKTEFDPRQYMLSRDFEIYYYSDTSFHNVNRHTHDYYEFYFFLEGDVSMEIGADRYPLSYGDVILIPPGMTHRALVRDTKTCVYRRIVFWISRDFCSRLETQSEDYTYLMRCVERTGKYIFHYDVISYNLLQSKIFALIEEIHANRFGKAQKVSLCVEDLILHLNRSVYEMEQPHVPYEDASLYQGLILYIERHMDEELTLDQLADYFYVSKYHIAHIFKENTGLSIHQFIIKKRLDACRAAMLNGTSIQETYQRYGFRDYSAFFRAFKKEYGLSPKEYREIYGRKPDDRELDDHEPAAGPALNPSADASGHYFRSNPK